MVDILIGQLPLFHSISNPCGIECSKDGVDFYQMRICHMYKGKGEIQFSIYACSPEDSSFKAVFTDMELMESQWKRHVGQKPD